MKKYGNFNENGVRLRHCSLFTVRCSLPRGISLMEVLASTFVIGVGLMGVLAVIPFGAYQVNKANNADYCAGVLRDAAAEIQVREMAKPYRWNNGNDINSNGNTPVLSATATTACGFNCNQFVMVDPFDTGSVDPSFGSTTIIHKIGRYISFSTMTVAQQERWRESMRCQDDIQYTMAEDKRTVLTTSGAMNSVSSGQYTWFFTFQPGTPSTATAMNNVPIRNLPSSVSVDILACYNRSPGDAMKERTVGFRIAGSVNDYSAQLSGAQIYLRSDSAEKLDFSRTKRIFVTWPTYDSVPRLPVTGCWCKVVSVGQLISENNAALNTTYKRMVTLVGDLPASLPLSGGATTGYAYVVDGVLDHVRIDNVPLY